MKINVLKTKRIAVEMIYAHRSKYTGDRKKSVIKSQKQKKKSCCPLNPGKPKTFDNLDFFDSTGWFNQSTWDIGALEILVSKILYTLTKV